MGNIIQSLWVGKQLSIMEHLCIESYLQNGHEFHLYLYDDICDLPKGVVVKNANTIIDYRELFLDSRSGIASFSDYFRYKLLYERGNCWTDMDMVCLKPITLSDDFIFSTEYNQQGTSVINNGFIKSTPKAEFLYEILQVISENGFDNVQWGMFGPSLLNHILQSYDSQNYIKRPEIFCPINWFAFKNLICESGYEISDEAYTIHLWNEMWRLENINKDLAFPENSIYEKLKSKYLGGERYRAHV
jgi:mannosyltransferase OCH1-like enzyme